MRRAGLVTVVGIAALVPAGCGGDDASESAPAAGEEPSYVLFDDDEEDRGVKATDIDLSMRVGGVDDDVVTVEVVAEPSVDVEQLVVDVEAAGAAEVVGEGETAEGPVAAHAPLRMTADVRVDEGLSDVVARAAAPAGELTGRNATLYLLVEGGVVYASPASRDSVVRQALDRRRAEGAISAHEYEERIDALLGGN